MTDTTPGPDHRAEVPLTVETIDSTTAPTIDSTTAPTIDYGALAKQVADRVIPPVKVTTSAKAFVGAALSGLVAGGAAVVTAFNDGVITGSEWIAVAGAIAVGAGLVGPSVYATTNKRVEA